MTIATAVSCAVIDKLCPSKVLTFSFVIMETPKSPWTICPSQRK